MKEQLPAYHYLDSLVKRSVASHPDAGLLHQLTIAYEELNHRPNPVLLPLDTMATNARIETRSLLSTTAGVYMWQGLFDSLHFNAELQEVLPAVAAYNKYLCECVSAGNPGDAYQQFGKVMRRRLDSCKGKVHDWSGWVDYKRLADSVGVQKLRSRPQDAYTAYLLRTCGLYRNMVRMGLPEFTGYSPRERYIIRLNEFHNRMTNAVISGNTQFAASYAGSALLKSLNTYFKAIRSTFAGREVTLRMSFYNDVGRFYFLMPKGDRMQVYSMLSYDFSYNDEQLHISNLQYRLRTALPAGEISNDDMIFQHMFRYPLIALGVYGLPLNTEIPQVGIRRSTYEEDLKGVDLTPPLE